MQADIHPEYHQINVTCSCGHTFVTGSTLSGKLHIEVCNECHPFYTGKQKIVDTAGRVERFKDKFSKLGKTAPPPKPEVTKGKTQAKGKAATKGKSKKAAEKVEKSEKQDKRQTGHTESKDTESKDTE